MPLVVCLECPELCLLELTEVLALLATRLGGKKQKPRRDLTRARSGLSSGKHRPEFMNNEGLWSGIVREFLSGFLIRHRNKKNTSVVS